MTMSDELINEYTSNLSKEEEEASNAVYKELKDEENCYGQKTLSDELIIEKLFHGDVTKTKNSIKEVEDIHVKRTGNGFVLSRYSEEREKDDSAYVSELKKQNKELRDGYEKIHKEFEELKELISQKLR